MANIGHYLLITPNLFFEMKRTTSLLLLATALLSGNTYAQERCATDQVHRQLLKEHPELAERERAFNEAISKTLSHIDPATLQRTTTDAGTILHIPVVVHIQHSFTSDYMTDESVYAVINRMNNTYSLNYDTSVIIAPFKKFVGKANIKFHLATKDPQGNPTTGITRRFSYLAAGGDDQVKMDQWSPSSYYNIWFESFIGRTVVGGVVLAYAQFPMDFLYRPFYDGVICASGALNDGSTLEHETGHYLSLYHPWNSSGQACGEACGDDAVDDTPPTVGHPSGCALYDTTCATNYFKVYQKTVDPNIGTDSILVNYPDTTNTQNIMDYASCEVMFTKGQVVRMRNCLDADEAQRNNLPDSVNLAFTGALEARPDLTPIPDFHTTYSGTKPQWFTCPGTPLRFTNKTWRDTVNTLEWSFSNGAAIPTTTLSHPDFSTTVTNTFSDGGWVNITMKATGNNSGTTTRTFNDRVFVADPNATNAAAIVEEFDPAGTLAKWPTFNYFNNEFKWQPADRGMYDGHCMMYTGYDARLNPAAGYYPRTGTPKGDYDDMYSIPVDLSAFTSGDCNMNFYTSAATRTSNALDVSDTLLIAYSIDYGKTWVNMTTLSKNTLINKGAYAGAYAPIAISDWVGRSISIPTAARKPYVVFRFRYQPGVDHNGYLESTGNNFYLDRLSFSQHTVGVDDVKMNGANVLVVPNPTNNNAFVIISDAASTTAKIAVTDVTGKTVYTTAASLTANETRIEIPQSAISVPGMYMVQVITGSRSVTHKLVVY